MTKEANAKAEAFDATAKVENIGAKDAVADAQRRVEEAEAKLAGAEEKARKQSAHLQEAEVARTDAEREVSAAKRALDEVSE